MIAVAIWCAGDKYLPAGLVNLAASIVPGLVGHALAFTPDTLATTSVDNTKVTP